MEQSEFLLAVIERFEALRLPYFVTGSVASAYFGEARPFKNINIVARVTADRVDDVCAAFPSPAFLVNERSIRKAVRGIEWFYILSPGSALIATVIIPNRDAFNESRFERARRVRPHGDSEASFASPEDVILKKLEYVHEGASQKHLRDIIGILSVSGKQLDWQYIANWAERLGLSQAWRDVRSRIESDNSQSPQRPAT